MREARDNIEVDVANHVCPSDRVCSLDSGPEAVKESNEGGDVEMKESEHANDDNAVKNGTESNSKPSPPSLPAKDRMTAAFVLDYLKHHGHTAALDSTRTEMVRRSWIPSPAEKSSATLESDETLIKINLIYRQLMIPGAAVPIELVKQLLPWHSSLYHRMSIHHLVYSIQDVKGDEDEDEDMRVVAYGQDLHQNARDQPWGPDEVELLEEAVGLLVIELDKEGEKKWLERRRLDAELLDSHLRSESIRSSITGNPSIPELMWFSHTWSIRPISIGGRYSSDWGGE